MIDENVFCHRIFEHDGDFLLLRTCVQRPSDGKFAAVYLDRIPVAGVDDKKIDDLGTPWNEMAFTTEDRDGWEWFDSLDLAIAAHKRVFASYESWTVRAPNQ